MQRDEIKAAITAAMPEATPEAIEAAVSAALNLFHKEMNAVKKSEAAAADKAAKAEEKAATASALEQEVAALKSQIDQLTAQNKEANIRSNKATAISRLREAGMDENLAATLAQTSVSEDEKVSAAAVDAIIAAYSAQEQARAAEAAKNGMLGMPFPSPDGGQPKTDENKAVDYAKKLAESRAMRSSNGTLDGFKN